MTSSKDQQRVVLFRECAELAEEALGQGDGRVGGPARFQDDRGDIACCQALVDELEIVHRRDDD